MVFAVVFVALCLAVYRVSRLLTKDEIPLIKAPRDWLVTWLDPIDAQGEPAPHSKAALAATPTAVALIFLTVAVVMVTGYRPAWLLITEFTIAVLLAIVSWKQERTARSVAYLAECPWCTSVYVAAGFCLAAAFWLPLGGIAKHPLTWIFAGLAASAVTGLIASVESRIEQRYKLDELEIDRRTAEQPKQAAAGRMPR